MDENFGWSVDIMEMGLPSIQQDTGHNAPLGLLPMDEEALQCPVEQDEHTGTHLKCAVGVGWRPGEGRD